MFDTIIKDGMIVDGTRMPRFRGDVAIKDGVIARVGRLDAKDAARVLDASGMIVAPGFIDLHTHYDAQVFWDPYCSISGWHGVTSAVIGNCGFGFAPVRPDERERAMLTMTRVEAIPYASMKAGMPWDWVSFPEFLDSLDRSPKGINILPYVPIAPMLIYVMGLEAAKSRKPTAAEEAQLCELLDQAMEAGGCGWSAQRLNPASGLMTQRDYDGTPMVTDLMADETCLALARVLGRRNEGFIQMVLATGNLKRDATFFEQLAEVSGRPVLFNAVQCTAAFPDLHRKSIKWLEKCRQRGLRVYGQGITTDAGLTFSLADFNLFDDADAWCEATTGTLEERKAKLADPARRPGLRAARPIVATTDLGEIVIVEVYRPELKHLENMTLRQVAEREGKHIVDVMLDTAVADDLRTDFYARAINSPLDLQKEVVAYEYVIPGASDGGAHTKFLTAGRYPTEFLTKHVREHHTLNLEDAHWRLSALPAYCAGFADRGLLREGHAADIVVYDFDRLKITPVEVVHDLPGGEWRRVQRAEGYRYILVNGETTLIDGQTTGETPGHLLRHGKASEQSAARAA
ncbi:MAG TPA: amidohydrolase family protein [Candidatus Binataceae bacterium]|jgi:N-acyl-D-aspartate/D-glutamate deacylase|nr:amidohydrolase family protein [Candidatus Binataceae bacterium]